MNEKQICQQAIFPFLLGVTAARALTGQNERYIGETEKVITKLITGYDRHKILRRLSRCSANVIDSVVDKQSDFVNGHKFILIIYFTAQRTLNSGIILSQEVLDLFDVFLDIEAGMTKTHDGKIITDEDHEKLKKSSDKASERIFEIIKNV